MSDFNLRAQEDFYDRSMSVDPAQIHAKIAAKVYPDASEIWAHRPPIDPDGTCRIRMGQYQQIFDLLETDDDIPTQQAKASALDVFVWITDFNNKNMRPCTVHITSGNPCAAIYEAAKEIVCDTQ